MATLFDMTYLLVYSILQVTIVVLTTLPDHCLIGRLLAGMGGGGGQFVIRKDLGEVLQKYLCA